MDIFDSQEWEQATKRLFDEYSYFLDESAIQISYKFDIVGPPGNEWDLYQIFIEGCDSGDRAVLISVKDGGNGQNVNVDFSELAQELANYIADSQGGSIEEEDDESWTITF